MTTTRPGFIWSGTEWVAIGQEAIVNPFYYQATAPTTASTGDIWIESDVDVPSIDSAQFLRWRKTMAGGETSLSGNDDNSLPLQYTPGYEQLYINGVLMVRGQDYTATTGTTITGLTALTVNDVVEVFSTLARTVADVYTQTQVDSKLGESGWTSWTPVFSQPGVISGGTINAAYTQIGKTVIARCDYTFTNVGISGAITCNLPVAAKSAGTYTVGSFNFLDNGTNFYNGVCRLASATSILSFFNGGTVGNTLGNSPTFAAAVGDYINFTITYEAA